MKVNVTLDWELPKTLKKRYWDTFHKLKRQPPDDMDANPEFRKFRRDIFKRANQRGLRVKRSRKENPNLYIFALYKAEKRMPDQSNELRRWFFGEMFFEPDSSPIPLLSPSGSPPKSAKGGDMSENLGFNFLEILASLESAADYAPEIKAMGLEDEIRELVDALGKAADQWSSGGTLDDGDLDAAKRRIWRLRELLVTRRYANYCPACRYRFRAATVDTDDNKEQGPLLARFCPFCGEPLILDHG